MAWYDRFFPPSSRYDRPPEPRSPLDVSDEMVRLINKIPVTSWEDMTNKLGIHRRTYAVKIGIALFALTCDELVMWEKASDAGSKAATESWNIRKSSLVRLFHRFVDEEQKISKMRFEKTRKEADTHAEGILGRGLDDPAYEWL